MINNINYGWYLRKLVKVEKLKFYYDILLNILYFEFIIKYLLLNLLKNRNRKRDFGIKNID